MLHSQVQSVNSKRGCMFIDHFKCLSGIVGAVVDLELSFCASLTLACVLSEICDGWEFLTMVLVGNKAYHLSLVNHSIKTIYHGHHTSATFSQKRFNLMFCERFLKTFELVSRPDQGSHFIPSFSDVFKRL